MGPGRADHELLRRAPLTSTPPAWRRGSRVTRRASTLPWVDTDELESGERFDALVRDAIDTLPPELAERVSNLAITVDDDPPPGQRLLGLYQGVPLTRRGAYYGGALPDKITIYRRPLERLYGADPARLRAEVRRVVLHEIAHHFGISDARLVEIDRY
jgi:predicted Zn-dependent protease with MMP-like domain